MPTKFLLLSTLVLPLQSMVFIKLSQHFSLSLSLSLSLFSQRFEKIEEEIEMLQCKLKNIEKGIAFSGKKTKTARSQGRKIQITVEHERPRS
ncbi:hypothetical protein POPTR_009G033201v4 [Populus trichocarpa]|uniref:Uncharacterized protein n=1 Tax=Populus trichocarpa TaxID=3694 RepID=A0ACC0SGB9_POPTR|nr:hypothetical protein POPTR_009G033201v4 [Populus trichocarpa]